MSEQDAPSRLVVEAKAIHSARVFARALTLNRLFDVLVAEAEAGRVPTELDLAVKVFGKPEDFDVANDSTVRVNVHRLRLRLAEYYQQSLPADGCYLTIPRGSYQLKLINAEALRRPQTNAFSSTLPTRRNLIWGFGGATAGVALGASLSSALFKSNSASDPIIHLPPWKHLTSSRPVILALNDFYIFGDNQNGLSIERLVRQFNINSSAELEAYRAAGHTDGTRFVDLDMAYVPVDVALAQQALPLAQPNVMPVSGLTPDILRQNHVVYLGYFSGLSLLRDPLTKRSRLAKGANFDELIDLKNGEVYASGTVGRSAQDGVQTDYGYVASLKSPSSGRLIIVAGTRDAGLIHMSRLLTSKDSLKRLISVLGEADEFEALYRVESMGRVDMQSELVFAQPL